MCWLTVWSLAFYCNVPKLVLLRFGLTFKNLDDKFNEILNFLLLNITGLGHTQEYRYDVLGDSSRDFDSRRRVNDSFLTTTKSSSIFLQEPVDSANKPFCINSC